MTSTSLMMESFAEVKSPCQAFCLHAANMHFTMTTVADLPHKLVQFQLLSFKKEDPTMWPSILIFSQHREEFIIILSDKQEITCSQCFYARVRC